MKIRVSGIYTTPAADFFDFTFETPHPRLRGQTTTVCLALELIQFCSGKRGLTWYILVATWYVVTIRGILLLTTGTYRWTIRVIQQHCIGVPQ